MASACAVRGIVTQAEAPLWSPLEAILGTELAGCFMWMHEVRLHDGSRIDAYKHVTTRRYLHLAADGSAFAWRFDSSYQRVDLAVAIVGVFDGWERARPPLSHRRSLGAIIDAIRSRAA